MIQAIIDGISATLFNLFGANIYVESVKQGLKEPCFIISTINVTFKPLLGSRGKLKSRYQIVYLPKGPDKTSEINRVIPVFMSEMDFLTLANGVKLYALNRRASIDNDGEGEILRFFVDYVLIVSKEENNDFMFDLFPNILLKR